MLDKRTMLSCQECIVGRTWLNKNHWIYHYSLYVVIYIWNCILCYSKHGVCFSAACLPICKNTCWITCGSSFNISFVVEAMYSITKSIITALTVNTTDNWKSNLFCPCIVYLPCRTVTPKYSVYVEKAKEKRWLDNSMHISR